MSEDQRRVREERDAYKRVFSQIRIPEPVSLETVRKEERTGGWMKFYTKHAAAVAAAMVIVASTGVAYAADLGGLRTTVNVWLRGENKEIVADPMGMAATRSMKRETTNLLAAGEVCILTTMVRNMYWGPRMWRIPWCRWWKNGMTVLTG